MVKRILIAILILSSLNFFWPKFAGAQTISNANQQQLISLLLELIKQLQAQLALVQQASQQATNFIPAIINQSNSATLPTWSPGDNQPPVISGIVGPSALSPEEAGTWQINATDPDSSAAGGRLIYTVIWGDATAPAVSTSTTATSFTHTYATAGVYYLTFIVSDGAKTVRQNANVVVATRAVPTVNGTAQINVSDATTGSLITNAQVVVLSATGQVIGTGNTYSGPVTFSNLPIGAYTATVAAFGYGPGNKPFSILRDGAVVQVAVTLTKIPVVPLRVTVRDITTNLPLANTVVTVYGPNGLPFVVRQTGANGSIEFPNLTPGTTFQVGTYHLGYKLPARTSVTIPTTGSPAALNINLEPNR